MHHGTSTADAVLGVLSAQLRVPSFWDVEDDQLFEWKEICASVRSGRSGAVAGVITFPLAVR